MSVLVNDSDSVIKPFSPTVAKPPVPAVKYRDFGDAVTARDSIYQSVLDTTRNLQPLTNTKHTLALSGVDYAEPGNFTLKQQKEAILTGKTLGRRLVGTWELRNNADGQVLDSKRMTLAKVPYMTDRGTFIHNGSEYTLSNQMRLRPGIFTRVKDNGEVEAHANIMPGKGASHRYFLDPAKGIFYVKFGQAKIPLMPLVKALGAKDSDLQKSWGNELWQANAQKNDPVTLNKILAKLVRKIDPEAPLENKYKAIKDAIEKMEVDPEVTQSTLGIPMKNLNLDGIMATTKKLLAVSRGESEVDDRDHLLFQNIYGPEDLLAERIAKDAGGIRRALFYKSSFKNNLSSMQPGLLTKQLESALLHSGLGQCFDDKTSVLTARGWLLWSEVTADDLFACEIDGVLTYHKAYKLHEYDYDGELLGCRTRRFDYLVTPNHRLWCKAKPHAEYRAEHAGIAHCRGRYFSTSLPEQTATVNTADFILPAVGSGRWRKSTGPKTLPGDVWARFLGWYMAEGWVSEEPGNATRSQRKRVCLSQCNQANPAGHRDIVDVLSKLGFNWRYQASNKTFYINDKQLATELLRYGKGSANKRLPRYVFQWDRRRLRLLCDSYISGDGNDYNGYIKAETTSLHLAQDLVELFGRLGGTGRITKRLLSEKNPNWADSYVVSFGINRETYVSGSSDCARTGNPLAYYQQRYVGKVYCASVPGEKLYVMRNGKPHWSLNSIEEINPSDVLDKQSRISRMGEGGIPSMDSVPDESRAVQPSHFGFVDPVRTPESLRTGVDAFIANTARKGSDGRFYSPFLNNKGETVWKSPQDLANMTVAFPQEINRNTKRIGVMQGGKIKFVPRQDVDLVMPNFENAFSPLGNMVPIKSAVKAQRMAMASRMLTQALPLEEPEAPLVRTGIAGEPDNSYERKFGRHMGAIVADKPGMVIAADSEKIRVKYDDGTVEDKELYKSFPYNRKTYVDNTPVVRPGDRFGIGQALAKSNYTDNEGVTALGKNLHVAYLPFKGFNFEDANVISESAAKKLSSQHMYQHGIDWSADYKQGKAAYIGMFANKYDRKTLDKLDDDGVIKEGSIVKYGDPLVLAAKQKEASYGKVHKQRQAAFSDATDTWDHHTDGVVTDVVKTAKGTTVLVKSAAQMEVGDKLSGRFGDKGVIAAIIPDDQMPKDASGKPFEVLLNPLGIISRTNPAQMVEAALGKIAKKTGKAYNVSDFDSIDDMTEYAIKELQKHGLSDLEDVEDSETGRKIKGVFTGNRFFMKLHHTSASKGQGRGTGGYAMDGTPAKGGETGSKRISVLDSNALLSHGATEVLRDVGSIRGQRNEEFWLPFMQGLPTPKPKIPFIYQKFVNELQASGINVVRDGTTLNIMALTNKDVDALAGDRYIQSGDTVQFEKGMKPVPGGLFDPTLTGGNNGNRWSAIKLHEPMPNPVMEEPIRRLLNLTQKDFNNVIAGKKEIAGHTGTSAIVNALSLLNIDKEIAVARESIKSGRATHRDAAVRKLGYLKAAKDLNMHPKDWILNKAPVLPPIFRPVAVMSDNKMPLVADANYLYKELLEANDNLRDMSKEVDDVGEERLSVYNAFKAVTGLGDPVHPKLQEKQVKGLLKHIFGSSPKFGSVQRRLISSTVDLVGRAVITPNPDLDMDHVGLPEERAWDIYKNFIVRRLKRRGLPLLEAAKQVENRTAVAKKEMLEEMADRPVIINRAPVLHRFGIMAFYPKLVKGNTLQISPLIVKGFGADFDGDAMQYHVPVSDESKKEATERMLPSRNLLSPIDFKSPVHSPSQEYTGGLYTATAGRSGKKTQVFRSLKDAAAAYKRGDLDIDDPVEILS